MDKSERIKDLVELLNKANKAYYQEANEIMTNFEYDKLYDELVGLEKETGMVLSNSPTVNVIRLSVSCQRSNTTALCFPLIRLKKLEHWQILQETESVFCLGKWTA